MPEEILNEGTEEVTETGEVEELVPANEEETLPEVAPEEAEELVNSEEV